MKKRIFITSLLLFLSSCVSFESRIGYELKYTTIDQIRVGSFTKSDVVELVGFTPGLKASFGEDIWYYTYEKRSKYNNLISRQIVELKFNKAGIVTDKTIITEADGLEIVMDENSTKTNIERGSWFNLVFGGIG